MATLKLCTAPTIDGLCAEPSLESRCPLHPHEPRKKAGREKRGYDDAWRKLSQRARDLQPWCSACGTSEDLTADHLQWPARTLRDVDVLCRPCNAAKGAPTPENDPRGKTHAAPPPHPRGKAFQNTQLVSQYAFGEAEHG